MTKGALPTKGLIHKLVEENARDILDSYPFEEIVQECEIEADSKAHKWDPERGKWSTFVRQICLSKISRLREKARKLPIPVDHGEYDWSLSSPPLIDMVVTIEFLVLFYNSLSEREKKILEQTLDGIRQEDIADKLSIKRSRVAQIIQEIRKKLKTKWLS